MQTNKNNVTTEPDLIEEKTERLKLRYYFGSYPAKGFEKSESKTKNGLLGGRFLFELNGFYYDFTNFHKIGYWKETYSEMQDALTDKFRCLTITIPVTESQLFMLFWMIKDHNGKAQRSVDKIPIEYSAFFRHKHTITVYRLLAEIAILPKLPSWFIWLRFNYERTLRRYIMRKAFKNLWRMNFTEGRETRIWESI
jgi:hypothetical protein